MRGAKPWSPDSLHPPDRVNWRGAILWTIITALLLSIPIVLVVFLLRVSDL